jgi:hypothetical protein
MSKLREAVQKLLDDCRKGGDCPFNCRSFRDEGQHSEDCGLFPIVAALEPGSGELREPLLDAISGLVQLLDPNADPVHPDIARGRLAAAKQLLRSEATPQPQPQPSRVVEEAEIRGWADRVWNIAERRSIDRESSLRLKGLADDIHNAYKRLRATPTISDGDMEERIQEVPSERNNSDVAY